MQRARSDTFVLIRRNKDETNGLVRLQVDDALGLGAPSFLRDEDRTSKVFRSKLRVPMGLNPTSFHSREIIRNKRGVLNTTKTDKIRKLSNESTQADS